MSDQRNEPLYNLSYTKSNDFILARYKASLLENQIMAIALSRMEVNANDKDFPLEARLYPRELTSLLSDEQHIYRDLKLVAKTIPGRVMFIEDGKGNFKSFSVVTNADYEDGVFVIKFNNEIRDRVYGLEGRYTTLELSIMTSFHSNASFRLYEVLKKDAYKIGKSNSVYTEVEYNLSELRFILGLANGEDQHVKAAMAKMGNYIDWDELYEKLDKKDKTYLEWRDFQRYVLKKAQVEMETSSDIRFEYEPIKEQRKIRRVRFRIYKNKPKSIEQISENQKLLDKLSRPGRQLEMPLDVQPEIFKKYVGHNKLTEQDITLLINKANGDTEAVEKAIHLADQQPSINNYMGWLIKCIEDNYSNIETVSGSTEKAEQLNEIVAAYEQNKEKIGHNLWNKIKTKEEYVEFENEVKSLGMDVEQLELIYNVQELVTLFTNWKCGKGIDL